MSMVLTSRLRRLFLVACNVGIVLFVFHSSLLSFAYDVLAIANGDITLLLLTCQELI